MQEGEGGVQGVAPGPHLFSSFSLQNEGTRLQKDLRTYLASVKGKGQTWPGWARLHGCRAGPSHVELMCKELGRRHGLWGKGKD